MPLTSSILWGFIRLCFMLLFIYYLNRKFVNTSGSNNFLEFLVWQWFRYGTIMGVVIFATVQLNIYSLVNCVIILIMIIAIDYIGLKNLRHPITYYNNVVRNNVSLVLQRIEISYPKTAWFKFKKKKKSKESGLYVLLLVIVLSIITFASRVYFFKYDSYSLSPVWIADLETVIGFDLQNWFAGESTVVGDLAYVNFYGKIANVTPEIALQSIGILESILIGVLMFWVVRKVTQSKNIAPVIAALTFTVVYTLSPVNIYYVLQNRPVFLALTFGLPVMVYYLKPGVLKMSKWQFFFSFLVAFFVIGLIDLFTLTILFPPFMLVGIFFAKKKSGNFKWVGLLSYLMSVVCIIGMYTLFGMYFQTDLKMFLHSNLLAVSSYTYIPQLVVELDTLLLYYRIASAGALLLLLAFAIFKKEDCRAALAFLIYFNLLLVLRSMNNSWIDDDLLTQGLAVFMPIVAGICLASVIRVFMPLYARLGKIRIAFVAVVLVCGVSAAAFYQQTNFDKLTESDPAQREVLEAYDNITRNYFPYSYAVVNNNMTQTLSTNKHFFMNYSDFIYDYPQQDSVYFKNINNPKFVKQHPDEIIPKSVLVFVFDEEKAADSEVYAENGELKPILMDQLALLKKRGRKVELFYDNDHVKVYEIVNEPKSSRTSDLIF
ncbi:MAG: hypothetical protein EOO50_06310 [Flavobacterium sp.]|uniref:hypothetical protein n=1 Tax=Flavobacterium sp. TaxID=239 RepID=UPI0011F7837C|nr:hypothetical protein [Flavobacterium sp.]RZJ67353.1 MAG: hypothetical protein EOO50_06310 [Flavobacterium sp.]